MFCQYSAAVMEAELLLCRVTNVLLVSALNLMKGDFNDTLASLEPSEPFPNTCSLWEQWVQHPIMRCVCDSCLNKIKHISLLHDFSESLIRYLINLHNLRGRQRRNMTIGVSSLWPGTVLGVLHLLPHLIFMPSCGTFPIFQAWEFR